MKGESKRGKFGGWGGGQELPGGGGGGKILREPSPKRSVGGLAKKTETEKVTGKKRKGNEHPVNQKV